MTALDSCLVVKQNLGKSKCVDLPNVWKTMITVPDTFSLASADYATEAALLTALQNKILAGINSRGYKWPDFSSFENLSEESQYEDTVLGQLPLRDGQYRFKIGISKSMCTHKSLFSHRAINEGKVYPVDLDNQMWGWKDEVTGNIHPLSLALLWTEKFMIGDGSSNASKSPVYVILQDNEEFDKYGVLIKTKVVRQIQPLTDVEINLLTGDAFAAAGFEVVVTQVCDGVPVSGLLVADFRFYAADGITLQSIATAAENADQPGRYNLVPTTVFADGSITLRSAATLTVQAYEVPESGVLAVNVP